MSEMMISTSLLFLGDEGDELASHVECDGAFWDLQHVEEMIYHGDILHNNLWQYRSVLARVTLNYESLRSDHVIYDSCFIQKSFCWIIHLHLTKRKVVLVNKKEKVHFLWIDYLLIFLIHGICKIFFFLMLSIFNITMWNE